MKEAPSIVVIASDHNGFTLKAQIKKYLKEHGIIPLDLGPHQENIKVDYVDYADQLSHIITDGEVAKGILICGTGVGMSIAANRHETVRAALIHNEFTAPKCREHNNANVLCLGSWLTPYQQVQHILDSWFGTDFGEGRHVKRIEKLSKTKGEKIVFTNGVFDIIHTGHIELLRFAKSLGNKLVVGINSDAAVREFKGPSRPINTEVDRKKVLESLTTVDQVIIFDNVDPKETRESIQPDILVKGGEWTADEVRERDNVSADIEIKICPFVDNYSTTEIIKKARSKETWKK
jgi:rfaE bifunctional protein nucleotidyltransferase chain/domain